MPKLTESAIEELAIERLEQLGYKYLHGSVIAFDGSSPERTSYSEVILDGRLRAAVDKINPQLPADVRAAAIKEVQRIHSPELLVNNEAFHRMLTEGVPVSIHKDGNERGERVWLIDFENPPNNDFLVVNQFTVLENQFNKRPDLILFVNGIPLVVIELKNAADENTTLHSAFQQLETYKLTIPSLFTSNALNVISDGFEAKAGSISAGFTRFMAWKTSDGKTEASPLIGQLETLIAGMLNPNALLDLIRHFVVFEKSKREDIKTGIVSITTVKKLAAYHQFYAVNAAVELTLRAANIISNDVVRQTPESYGLPGVSNQIRGDKKAGVVWHTQGSGKSLSMVFYTGKIVLAMHNPTILVITDRNDLDDQLFDTFSSAKQLLRQDPVQAENRDHLKDLLRVAAGGVVFSTIQKFQPESGNIHDELSSRSNIVVIADEAHRTQYGFAAKTVEVKDDQGNVIGQKVVYGFAKYLRDALPAATYLGFTGTPIEKTDVNTPAVFGNYVDIYDISQAVEDSATVRICYESRLARVGLSEEGKELIKNLDNELDDLTETQKAKAKWTKMEALIGSEKRIQNIAKDKEQRKRLAERMKDDDDPLQLVIVRDMWLTGFDAPSMHTLYIDKPMKGHNLMQAIARVNRVCKDKQGGLVVDYLGIASDLKEALSFYSDAGGKGDPALVQEKAVEIMLEKIEVVSAMYHGFPYENYFDADTSAKLATILSAENHVLGLPDGKKRYIDAVTSLSQAFAIAIPHEQALGAKDEIGFFQAVRARLVKFDSTGEGRTNAEIETTIRQVIDAALVSEQVIDVFDAAGIKKPEISILSDDFLAELKGNEHQNVAMEVLRKLLNDELKARAKRNLVQSKALLKMLEDAIKRYQNKILTAAEVIDELIKVSKEMVASDKEAKQLGLSDFEYAFYTAVASNDSAKLKVIVKRLLRQYGYPPDMQQLATETVLRQAEMIADELMRDNF